VVDWSGEPVGARRFDTHLPSSGLLTSGVPGLRLSPGEPRQRERYSGASPPGYTCDALAGGHPAAALVCPGQVLIKSEQNPRSGIDIQIDLCAQTPLSPEAEPIQIEIEVWASLPARHLIPASTGSRVGLQYTLLP